MYNFKRINNITGWVIFAVATLVYIFTIEETASFWDCGEFIAVSYKLEVPHPPGAPFFLLVGRIFSFLAFGNEEMVAFWINVVSALSSGFTILFLFWTITLLGRKVLNVEDDQLNRTQALSLMGAGVIGSLVYTFSDSFWFSAVEAEVYAMSSFFTAFVFWAILKWEQIQDRATRMKWLILIAYMVGLSIGVHLLNLVAIPALALIYYFRNHKTTAWGVVATLLVSGFIVILINNIIIPGLPSIAGSFEIFFVNSIGLPFGSGIIFFVLLFIGALVYGIYISQKQQRLVLNVSLLSLAFILIGYASYTMIVIRSNFNPPIDENNPENIVSFVSYLKREQYGSRPLLYGQYFTAEVVDQKQGAPIYIKGDEKYEISDHKLDYVYDPDQMTILPRAYSNSPNHKDIYRDWMNLKEGEKPTFADNLLYMFRYQLGHMYMRYFMWNFAGRESDEQDAGWLSIFDAFEEVPEMLEMNKGRNNYLMLPLILGLVGLIFQYQKDPKYFSAVALLFFLTGAALVLYLNSPPQEPRERDYIYAGSFYVFAIWVGFGVMALQNLLDRFVKKAHIAAVIAFLVCLPAPIIMAAQNWDDHDRSDRYFSVDSAKNFLASCAPNAILFTGGDNDTFPLWYVQEVEGFRTDVRVIVLSYFNTDWYIEQMTRKMNDSEPLPISFSKEEFRQGGPNDYILYREYSNIKGPISITDYLAELKKKNTRLKMDTRFGGYHITPAQSFYLNINKNEVLNKGIIPENMEDLVTDRMVWTMKGSGIEKNTLMLMDIMATNNWERPIYFNNTSLNSIGIDLSRYVVTEGNCYRLLPVENPVSNPGGDAYLVNTEVMYDNLMQNFYYRNLDDPGVYYNQDHRNFALNHRSSFNTLAESLVAEGKDEQALEVVNKSLTTIPDVSIPWDYTIATKTIPLLFELGEAEKATEISQTMASRADEMLNYMVENDLNDRYEIQKNLSVLNFIARSLDNNNQKELADQYNQAVEQHLGNLQMFNMRNR